jgi:hypothetical protein
MATTDSLDQGSQRLPAQKHLLNFFATIAVTCILLVLLEILSFGALRLLSRFVFDQTKAKQILAAYRGESWAPALAREEVASRELYDYYPYIIWRRHSFRGQTVNIDEHGMRRTYYSHCDANQYTIWMFGGSTMRGNGSPDWGTIPSQLAQIFADAGQPVCVRNYGEGAWVSTQEVVQLMLALKSETRRPNYVIFYDGANDTYVPYQSGQADVHMNYTTIKNQFEAQHSLRAGSFSYLLHTNTAQLVFTLVTRISQHYTDRPIPATDLDGLARGAVQNYLGNMDVVEGLAKQYGFDYSFFWQPVLYASHKVPAGNEQQILRSKVMAHLEAWCPRVYDLMQNEHRPHFYNLSNIFDNTREPVYLDWCHIVMKGNRVIAQRMYSVLQQSHSGQEDVKKGSS